MTPVEAAAAYLTSIGQAGSAEQCKNGRFRLTVQAFENFEKAIKDVQ